VSSFARAAVLKRIPSGVRPALHARAADALERRGEYTAAARQYLAAGQPHQTIALWSEHRLEETERGQAESALALLRAIQPEALQTEDQRRVLFALRAELYRKMGGIADGLADLSSTTWPSSHPLTPLAETLRGDLLEFSGGVESALAAYETALRALSAQPESREVDVHTKIGFIRLYRSRDLAQASQAALRARFRAESFHGKVLEEQGNFAGARERFVAAGALLDRLENPTPQRAMNEADLGRVAMARGEYREAVARIEAAIRLYEQIGDFALHANQHMNLSFALNAAGDHARALEAATAQLYFVKERGDSYLVSALACNAAEACAGLGRLDEAEHYIGLALQQEEAFHRHYILTAQAVVHVKRNNHALAEWHFEEAIRLAQECDDPFGEAPAWRGLAMSHAQQGEFARARAAMGHATDLFRQMAMTSQASDCAQTAAAWPES
jgi:tetratricopeptide (TPR) repeat protein